MELPWVMRKALRLVSELQARQGQRCATRRNAHVERAGEVSTGAFTPPSRAADPAR